MLRAIRVEPAGEWRDAPADTVVLDFDDRHRRRIAMTGVRGLSFLLDLEQAVALRHGDGLVLEDGRIVEVSAAPEPLAEIRARDADHMIRVAWHLGNRHLPTQLVGRKLRIRRDHVIEEMARGLGADVAHIEAAFDPEGGAYAPGSGHHHHHSHHDHGHHHHAGHDHDNAHRHDPHQAAPSKSTNDFTAADQHEMIHDRHREQGRDDDMRRHRTPRDHG